jgi:hypothetical protein
MGEMASVCCLIRRTSESSWWAHPAQRILKSRPNNATPHMSFPQESEPLCDVAVWKRRQKEHHLQC